METIYLNMTVKLRQGGRTAVRMSMEDVQEKFEALEDIYDAIPEKDWKVDMNVENYEYSFRMTSTGVPYVLAEVASDYSPWMVYMIYWDGKRFRAYIPTYGNTWNTKTKEMIGENPEEDVEFILSQIDKDEFYDNRDLDMVIDPDDPEEIYSELMNDYEIWYNEEACIKDFETRIQIQAK